ncbi:MAG: primase, partial [Pseudomonadota bacterium]
MARIPTDDIEQLKKDVSVERLVESAGIELKKSGKNRIGVCPFHDDSEPSLVVTPAKNLWHCFGCQLGGGPIDWVMKFRGVSFRHAVELLRADPSLAAAGVAGAGVEPVKRTSVRSLPPPVAFDADDQALLDQTIGYYHDTLKQSPEALAYLKARGLDHPDLVDRFLLGYANRTLGLRLPEKNRIAGEDIRTRLQRVGIYRESGHEHFNGSLVVPVLDADGHVLEVYGRKIRDDLRKGTPAHLYLPGAHRGVWNEQALAESREIILCEALIDAMTFWCAGFTNVTASYGIEGFTDAHLAAFKKYGTERVLIAYDRDDAGDRAAEKLAIELMAEGIECLRVLFPKGMDANSTALKLTPAHQSLGLMLRQAHWLGRGRDNPAAESEEIAAGTAPAVDLRPPAQLQHVPDIPLAAMPSTIPPLDAEDAPAPVDSDEQQFTFGDCVWRVRAWKKNCSPEQMRIHLQVRRDERYHVDMLDLYVA